MVSTYRNILKYLIAFLFVFAVSSRANAQDIAIKPVQIFYGKQMQEKQRQKGKVNLTHCIMIEQVVCRKSAYYQTVCPQAFAVQAEQIFNI